jgi:hypothetical protein
MKDDIIKRINNILKESIVVADVSQMERPLENKTFLKTFPNTEEIRAYINRKKFKIVHKDDKKIVVEISGDENAYI